MTYEVSLRMVAIILGLLVGLKGLVSILFPKQLRLGIKSMPRNYPLGIFLMIVAIVWSLWVISFVDLAEYSGLRLWFMLGTLLLGVATIIFLPDFLAARAFGILLLLGAEVLLSAAFPVNSPSRYVITFLAYFWAILGMVFVAVPYYFRDLLFWFCASERRFLGWSWGKLLFGAVLLGLGLFVY